VVLLLAPRADYPTFEPDELPPEVPWLTWQRTARRLRSRSRMGAVEEFLIDDLLTYLDEEGVVDPPQLTDEHRDALVYHHDAMAALLRICEIAAANVERRWGGPSEHGTYPEHNPREYWWTYPSKPRGRRHAVSGAELAFTWELLLESTDVLSDGRAGVPCLLAGVSGQRGSVASLSSAARDALRADNFAVLGPGDSNSREWDFAIQVAYPDAHPEVFAGDDLDAQAQTVAGWIQSAFREANATLAGDAVDWR
jgi:hypothetical protein